MSARDTMVAWLKDAHAMENSVIQTLERHVREAEEHPEMQNRLRTHLEQSRRHLDLVEGCLRSYGSSPSALKEGAGAITGLFQGIASAAASDTLVKNAIGDYATEHLEIASYRSLRAAAELLKDSETVSVCDMILREEEAMADYLAQHIGAVTRQHLGPVAHEVGRS
jgi:ferritin-like metal-binding protein YciE